MRLALRNALWLAVPEIFLLMAIVWLCGLAHSQQNNNLPSLIEGSLNDINMTSGNMLVGCVVAQMPGSPNSFTVTDTNGVVPSITMGTGNTLSGGSPNGFDPNLVVQEFWGVATSTGATALSVTGTIRQVNVVRMQLSGNLTFDAQNTNGNLSPNVDPSITVTTTQQNDVVVPCMGGGNSAGSYLANAVYVPTGQQFAVNDVQSELALTQLSWFRAGAAGVQTANFTGGSQAPGEAISVVAFKPTSLNIGTSVLPDGGKGTAYSACLTAYGGAGAYTWSITAGSLQSGLSLNASTGCITGTPTASSVNSITFKATDGSNNATQALSLNIGSIVNTPFIRSSSTFSGIGTTPASVTAAKGDTIDIFYLGDDTHGADGYVLPASAISDSCGDAYTRMNPIVGQYIGGIIGLTTTAQCTGLIAISYGGGGPGDPLAGVTMSIANGQVIMDDAAVAQSSPGTATTTTTLSADCITTVPNELCLSLTTLGCSSGCSTSTSSPYSSVATATGIANFSIYSQSAPTAGTYTATGNFSVAAGMAAFPPLMAVVQIRPSTLITSAFNGEKKRRSMN